MTGLARLRAQGAVDWKNIRRDGLLLWVPLIPLVMALALRWGMPWLAGWVQVSWGWSVEPYAPLLMSGFLLTVPALVGMLGGFLLLDERDDRTLMALLVTPLPLRHYLAYRLAMPLLLGFVATLLGYGLAGLAPLPLAPLLAVALLGSSYAPLVALILAAFAENKVAGLALVKALNGIMLLPLLAWFAPMPWQLLVGLLPPYWPAKALWQAAAGDPYWPYLLAGLLATLLTLPPLLRRFHRIVHSL